MRECDNADLRDLLPDYARGALSGAERARIEAHLAACEPCRAELALLDHVRSAHPQPAVDVARIVAALPRPPRERAAAEPGVISLDARRDERARRDTARNVTPWRKVAGIAAVLVG